MRVNPRWMHDMILPLDIVRNDPLRIGEVKAARWEARSEGTQEYRRRSRGGVASNASRRSPFPVRFKYSIDEVAHCESSCV